MQRAERPCPHPFRECVSTSGKEKEKDEDDIKNEDTGVYYNAAKTSANGDGILAKIVSEDTVAIKVKPSKEKHTWTVTMEFEDYFCYILVKQN